MTDDLTRLENTLAYFANIGLLDSPPPIDDVMSKIDLVWGAPLEDIAESQAAADLVILSATPCPVFDAGAEGYNAGADAYVSLIERCAALAPDHLSVTEVTEDWIDDDTVVVSFEANGASHSHTPATKYIDPSILAVLNQAMPDAMVGFWACDALGMPSIVALLTPDQRLAVTSERGWELQPFAPNDVPTVGNHADPTAKRKWWRRKH